MKWNELSMKEKAAMMKVAISNGIADLDTIRNKFDEGGFLEDSDLGDEDILKLHPELKDRLNAKKPVIKPKNIDTSKGEREASLIQDALNSSTNSFNTFGEGYKKAAEKQQEESRETFKDYKKGLDATMTAAELASSAYMIGKGLKAMNWLPNNRVINGIYQSDVGQITANSLGTIADAYQLWNAETTRDKVENAIELPADIAGIIGGTNWLRNSRLFSRHGRTIDNIFDIMGYSAAGWDGIIKPANLIYDKFNKKEE